VGGTVAGDGVRTVLVTGFAPFAGDAANPSGDAVRALPAAWRRAERLVTAVLPVEFGRSGDELAALIAAHRPDVVLATGLAGGRSRVSLERVAINVDDARIADNAGARPVDAAIEADGPAARFSGLPVKAAWAALGAADIPAEVSNTAGTFVCNHVFYRAVGLAAPGVRAGFVHVPWSTETATDADVPSLPLAVLVDALRTIAEVSLDTDADARIGAGTLH
jgi:pyroglutamyl-peptidase